MVKKRVLFILVSIILFIQCVFIVYIAVSLQINSNLFGLYKPRLQYEEADKRIEEIKEKWGYKITSKIDYGYNKLYEFKKDDNEDIIITLSIDFMNGYYDLNCSNILQDMSAVGKYTLSDKFLLELANAISKMSFSEMRIIEENSNCINEFTVYNSSNPEVNKSFFGYYRIGDIYYYKYSLGYMISGYDRILYEAFNF